MDFARKILGKYGWKDGDGLGKNNNGIAKPLRATLKFDSAGLGADQAASDFNNHWWERVFNDAANNVEVKKEGDSVKMDIIDNEDGVEISTKGYSMKKLKKAKQSRSSRHEKSPVAYNNFLQAATLTNTGCEIEKLDRINAGDIEVTQIKVLTDEELFKACGGRTAHKGARHGLKLSGKLARLEQQEKEMLAKMLAKENKVKGEETQQSRKKSAQISQAIMDVEIKDTISADKEAVKRKKKKRKDIEKETLEIEEKEAEDSQCYVPKKKKKRKDSTPNDESNEFPPRVKNKEKKLKHQDLKVPTEKKLKKSDCDEDQDQHTSVRNKKKSKKKTKTIEE